MTTAAEKRRKWARRKKQGNGSGAPKKPIGVLPEPFRNTQIFYKEDRVRYNKIPVAESKDNRCPRCGRIEVESRTTLIAVPGSKSKLRKVYFCRCPGLQAPAFPFRPYGSSAIEENLLICARPPATMTKAEYSALAESQGEDGLACSNPDCFILGTKDWVVDVGKPAISRVCLHCEKCGNLMQPGSNYLSAN